MCIAIEQWLLPMAIVCSICHWFYSTRGINNRDNTTLLPLFKDTGLRICVTHEVRITRYASNPPYTNCCLRAVATIYMGISVR